MESKKKIAAAMSAVMIYLQQEEIARAQAPVAVPPEIYHSLHTLYQQLKGFFGEI